MSGTIVTFYSYKGGVGRTMALANIGVVLASWGYSVLCVDWDLEAPGLGEYFRPYFIKQPDRGMVDLIPLLSSSARANWRDFVATARIPDLNARISVLASGSSGAEYPGRAQMLNWSELYHSAQLGTSIERLRDEWREHYDFVLIDSRTGISDVGGICTVQMPDIVFLFVAPNRQSIEGIRTITQRADAERRRLPLDRQNTLYVPIAARVETRVEHAISQTWLDRLSSVFQPLIEQWSDREVKTADVIRFCRVPYVPYFGFGERLAVKEERDRGPDSLSYWFYTLAALLAHKLGDTKLLVENRDSFVAAVRAADEGKSPQRSRYDVFISFSHEDEAIARELRRVLGQSGLKAASLKSDAKTARQAISDAGVLVQLVSDRYTKAQLADAELFLRTGLATELDRKLLPVILPGGDSRAIPSIARGFSYIDGRNLSPGNLFERVVAAVKSSSETALSQMDTAWIAEQRELALSLKALVGAKGAMELRFAPSQRLKSVPQGQLLRAASASQIETFGWPIGVVLENREEFKPKPVSDGIVASVQRADEHAFDYWCLRRDGTFYLMQSLFEDERVQGKLFFDTRIVRIAEALLYCRRLYLSLGLLESAGVSVGIRHNGLAGRALTAASPNRTLSIPRTTTADSVDTEVELTLREIDVDLDGAMRPFLAELFVLFDYFAISDDVLRSITTSFKQGKII